MVIANTQERIGEQTHMIRSLVEQRVAGLITIPVLDTGDDQVAELTRSGLPVVLLTRDLPGSGLPFVGPDGDAVGRLGARHLVEVHRCPTVAYFGGNAAAVPRIVRERAFRRMVDRRAAVVGTWNEPFDADLPTAYDTASRLLETGPPPAGVQCHSDSVAYGLLRALHERGLATDACRVLGIDNLRQSATWNPSVSSIAVHPMELGRISARILLRLLGQRDIEPGRPPAPTLSARESCGCRLTR
jgi:LacI family transcriptional regulator